MDGKKVGEREEEKREREPAKVPKFLFLESEERQSCVCADTAVHRGRRKVCCVQAVPADLTAAVFAVNHVSRW